MLCTRLTGLISILFLLGAALRAAETPKVGAAAPAFELQGLDGESARLAEFTAKGDVVLVVLRGWPGYQCPICDKQVNEFVGAKAEFAEAKAQLVFIYPGPAAELQAHAAEFRTMKGREWPAEFRLLLDPDYTLINAYDLRWNASKETAYPSTFVIDSQGVVRFAKISHNHGDRAKAADVLTALRKLDDR